MKTRYTLFIIILILLTLIPTVITVEAKKQPIQSYQSIDLVPAYAGDLPYNPDLPYRWRDCAGNLYSEAYIESYDYSQASVTVTFKQVDSTFHGTLTAYNLKPNFVYQLKLEGIPGTESNERIGLVGRWWREEWDGNEWTNGRNLNNKGDGSSPNPNDNEYSATKDLLDPTSPTGLRYRYTGYLVFDYLFTDSNGDASITFLPDSSYHVVWKTTQRGQTPNDGPLKTYSFDPEPSQWAYDIDHLPTEVTIFGEWERLPINEIFLMSGKYQCKVFLTEESFHGVDGPQSGSWAAAMEGTISFQIKDESNKGPKKPHPNK